MRDYITLVSEIEQLPDREYSITDFERRFTEAPVWTDPNNPHLAIKYQKSGSQDMLGLFREENLIALLVTQPLPREQTIAQIKLTMVAPSERQKGFMRMMINYHRQYVGLICSDDGQTDSAKNMWRALIRQPMGLKIVAWNLDTDTKILAKGLPDDQIWNEEESIVLLVENCDVHRYGNRREASIFEAAVMYPNQHRWDCNPHELFP